MGLKAEAPSGYYRCPPARQPRGVAGACVGAAGGGTRPPMSAANPATDEGVVGAAQKWPCPAISSRAARPTPALPFECSTSA